MLVKVELKNIGGTHICVTNEHTYGNSALKGVGIATTLNREKYVEDNRTVYVKDAGADDSEYTTYDVTTGRMSFSDCTRIQSWSNLLNPFSSRADIKIESDSWKTIFLDLRAVYYNLSGYAGNFGVDGNFDFYIDDEFQVSNESRSLLKLHNLMNTNYFSPLIIDQNNIIWKYTDSTTINNTGTEYKEDTVLKTNIKPYYQINKTESFSFDLQNIQTTISSDKFIVGFDIFPGYKYIELKGVPINMNVINANYIDFENFNFTFRT